MSVKKADEKLRLLLIQKGILERDIEKAQQTLNKAKSQLKFCCKKCKGSAPYKDTTLYISKGESDEGPFRGVEEYFSEHHIVCSLCGEHHRFLSDKSLDDYEVPYIKVKDSFGRVRLDQQWRQSSHPFYKKFGKIVEGSPGDKYKFTNH